MLWYRSMYSRVVVLQPNTLFRQSLKMLDDEETTDNELRSKFNQRWNRTPSGDLYKPLRAGTLALALVGD